MCKNVIKITFLRNNLFATESCFGVRLSRYCVGNLILKQNKRKWSLYSEQDSKQPGVTTWRNRRLGLLELLLLVVVL